MRVEWGFIYLSDSFVCSVKPCSNPRLPNAVHLWVDLQLSQDIAVVGVVYRHPENSIHAIDDFNANLIVLILSLEKLLYCLGDFRVNLLKFILKMIFEGIQICF